MKNINNFKTRSRVIVGTETVNGKEKIIEAIVIMNGNGKEIKIKHNLRKCTTAEALCYINMLSENTLYIHSVTESLTA